MQSQVRHIYQQLSVVEDEAEDECPGEARAVAKPGAEIEGKAIRVMLVISSGASLLTMIEAIIDLGGTGCKAIVATDFVFVPVGILLLLLLFSLSKCSSAGKSQSRQSAPSRSTRT
jgi:hypothetical protein